MEGGECLPGMQSRTLIRWMIVLVAAFAAAPASAQIYKWVDERGVTNYSNQPPADPGAVKKLGLVEDRISVYTPDKALTLAIEAFRQGSNQALAERISSLERQLEAERRARQYEAADAPATYDPCLGNRGIDCNVIYSGYYPFASAVVFVPVRHRPRPIVQPHLAPGTTAGNVVGMKGFIPGNSATASAGTVFPSRSFPSASMSGGFASR